MKTDQTRRPGSAESRQKAYRDGHWAEAVAAALLRLKGYRIEARRMKTPVGEIDLLARRGRSLVFVEVKRRASRADALAAITPHQQRRIARAALWYMSRTPALADHDLRFDVIALAPGRLPVHVKNAWTLNEVRM